MPLPLDQKLIDLSNDLLVQFDKIFGLHPGFRPAHAKGALFTGTFEPTKEAAKLSSAPHFANKSTPITVRFSNFTGIPVIPDTDPNAGPRGFALRFHLGDRVHTDIVGHSTDGFPTRTGDEFLEFLKALSNSPPDAPPPTPIEKFLGSHPAALAFAQTPKPPPTSFAREGYFGLSALKFVNNDNASRFGRYLIVPSAGVEFITDEKAVKSKGPNYLFEELSERIKKNPVTFKIRVQLSDDGDVVNDATNQWPKDREIVTLGTFSLTAAVPDPEDALEQKKIIFDPIPRVKGIEPTDDPLLELRAAIYLISGRRRRSAKLEDKL